MKRKEKLRQIAKEAKSVLWAVIAIIVFWSKQVTYHYFPYSVMGCHRMHRHMDIFHYCRCISDETRI